MNNYTKALSEFAKIATHSPGDKRPDDRILGLQIDLYRWQVKNFGLNSDMAFALGVIEEMGELEDAETPEEQFDAIGDIAVYGTQLLTNNRLGMNVALDDAEEMAVALHAAKSDGVILLPRMSAAGRLAHVVLKGSQGIRGLDDRDKYRKALYAALTELFSLVSVNSSMRRIFEDVAKQVMKRTAGHPAIPGGE